MIQHPASFSRSGVPGDRVVWLRPPPLPPAPAVAPGALAVVAATSLCFWIALIHLAVSWANS